MVRVSLALGIIAAIAGLVAIGFGIPIQAFGLGNTLILSGSTVFSAGLVVIALSMVMRVIDQLASELRGPALGVEPGSARPSFEHQSAGLPPGAPEWSSAPIAPAPREETPPTARPEARRAPLPARSGWQDEGAEPLPRVTRPPGGASPPRFEREPVPPSPEREGSVRSRLQSRAERSERPPRAPVMERPQPPDIERRREPVAPGEQSDSGDREPRVDPYAPPERRRVFGWTQRSKDRREDVTASGSHEAEPGFGAPPSAAARSPQGPVESQEMPRVPLRGAPPPSRERPVPPPPAPPPPASSPPASPPIPRAPAEQQAADDVQPVEVLKQGTVDGMSYTLYTDGSIDAEFPEGRLRFNSIDELREHLEAQN